MFVNKETTYLLSYLLTYLLTYLSIILSIVFRQNDVRLME